MDIVTLSVPPSGIVRVAIGVSAFALICGDAGTNGTSGAALGAPGDSPGPAWYTRRDSIHDTAVASLEALSQRRFTVEPARDLALSDDLGISDDLDSSDGLEVMDEPEVKKPAAAPGVPRSILPAEVPALLDRLRADFSDCGRDIELLHEALDQFELLEATRTGIRPSSRFATRDYVHREQSLTFESDRDPLDMVLRRTGALLNAIASMDPAPDLASERLALAELRSESAGAAIDQVVARLDLYLRCCRLRRRIAFANPLLNFRQLVFVKHKRNAGGERRGDHMAGQYYGIHATKGEGLFILEDAFGVGPAARNGLARATCRGGRHDGSPLPDGAFLSPDLSFDGQRILFAYCEAAGYCPSPPAPEDRENLYSYSGLRCSFTEANTWSIYGVGIDGTDLRAVTGGPWNDFDPCWVPDGRIAFVSDRRGGFGRCHLGANGGAPWFTYTLHAVNADGTGLVRLSHHETCEWQPSITHDGLIVYTRWDYVDRGFFQAHHPWTTTPDGRNAEALHGNYPKDWKDRPCMEMDIRSVPGSRRLAAVAAAHHGQTYGSIVLVDPNAEDDDAMSPVRLVTPDEPFPESEYGYFCRGAAYATPWPLSEDFFLCAYGYPSNKRSSREASVDNYGIYLLDSFGNRELLFRDPGIASLSPIPLRPRPSPPVLASLVAPYPSDPDQRRLNLDRPAVMAAAGARQRAYAQTLDRTPGVVSIANVYESRHPWPDNTRITALRIIQLLPKSAPGRNNPAIGYATEKNARRVLGTVPVEKDGSAYFYLPPHIPVYFQALDERGLAVQSMRSDVYVAPKEHLSCLGCHEPRSAAPPGLAGVPTAMRRSPSVIRPGPEGSAPFSFARLVQPVLDKRCVACHAKSQEKKAPPLHHGRPDTRGWSESYRNLQRHAFCYASGNFTLSKTIPGQFGARASGLYSMLKKGHHEVKLEAEELHRIALWLDCNSDFYGAYRELEKQAAAEIVPPILE